MTLQPLEWLASGEGDITAARANVKKHCFSRTRYGRQARVGRRNERACPVLSHARHMDAAEPLYEQVVTVARAIGDRESIAIGLLNLAMVSIGRAANVIEDPLDSAQ